MTPISLSIITQEKKLLTTEVDSITAPASEGEVTILPGHIPLFTKLDHGELIYRKDGIEKPIAITSGFMDVRPNNEVVIMVDSATLAENIDLKKAQEAREQAKNIMQEKREEKDFLIAEAQLRKALTEIKIHNKYSDSTK